MNKLKLTIITSFIFIIFAFAGLYNPSSAATTDITNKTNVDVDFSAERFSDNQLSIKTPKANSYEDLDLVEAKSNGRFTSNIDLGTKSDERENCVVLKGDRRTGICEDGVYKIKTISYDAAGNQNVASEYSIERDTVKPANPEVSLYLQGGNSIFANINGENDAEIIIDGTSSGNNADKNGLFLKYGSCESTYAFKFQLKDIAGNTSDAVTKSISTGACPRVQGSSSSFNISKSNPYGDDSVDKVLGKPMVRLKVTKKHNGEIEVQVQEKNIPAPVITFVDVNDNESQATAYGFAVYKNMKADIKIDMFIDGDCKLVTVNGSCPFGRNFDYEFREYTDTLDHTGLDFLENNNSFGWIWNDSSNGKFKYAFNLNNPSNNDINVGDEIYSISHVWGNTKFNVKDIDYEVEIFVDDEKGLESAESNRVNLRIGKLKKDILNKYKIEVVNGDTEWSEQELNWTAEVLDKIGTRFYNSEVLQKMKRYSIANFEDNNFSCNNDIGENDERVLGLYSLGCKSFYVFDSAVLSAGVQNKYGYVTPEEMFKINMVHELTHAFQKINYPKTVEFANISWRSIVSDGYSNVRKTDATNCDFTTAYLITSFEDMAEAYGLKYIKPVRFKEQYEKVKNLTDSLTFNGISYNLNVCGYYEDNSWVTIPFNETKLKTKEDFNY